MPCCRRCGNDKSLISTLVPTEPATANPPPYGLLAYFGPDGSIMNMECQGASLDDAQAAFEDPVRFFNKCSVCGESDILW